MINKYIKPKIGITLPNKQYEVSEIYFDQAIKNNAGANIDLRFDTIMERLNLHDLENTMQLMMLL